MEWLSRRKSQVLEIQLFFVVGQLKAICTWHHFVAMIAFLLESVSNSDEVFKMQSNIVKVIIQLRISPGVEGASALGCNYENGLIRKQERKAEMHISLWSNLEIKREKYAHLSDVLLQILVMQTLQEKTGMWMHFRDIKGVKDTLLEPCFYCKDYDYYYYIYYHYFLDNKTLTWLQRFLSKATYRSKWFRQQSWYTDSGHSKYL